MKPKFLIANPNTSERITQSMVEIARRLAGDRAEIVGATAPFGAPALETEADLETAELAVLSMMEAHEDCDGVLVAAFGDPGLHAARRASKVPVEGLGESGILAAAEGNRRFAILTLGPALKPAIEKKVDQMGLSMQLAAIDFLSCGVLDLAREPTRYLGEMNLKIEALAKHAGAEAVLLAGAPFAGMADMSIADAAIPLYDGLASALTALLRKRADFVSGICNVKE